MIFQTQQDEFSPSRRRRVFEPSATFGIRAYIRGPSLLYPHESRFSARLAQRPQEQAGEALACSQAAPTARPAHHSRSPSYLRPSDHHLHLTPPRIPRPGIQGLLATALVRRRAGQACTAAWTYPRSNVMTTERKAPFHLERHAAGGRGAGLIGEGTIMLDEGVNPKRT